MAAGASRAEASGPLRQAHDVAARIGARPLAGQLELLAQRARLELASPDAGSPDRKQGLDEILGLTPREAEVLALVARGYTNREIAAALVISVRTAGVHVSHILRKLDAPNRLEAAIAIAHRRPAARPGNPQPSETRGEPTRSSARHVQSSPQCARSARKRRGSADFLAGPVPSELPGCSRPGLRLLADAGTRPSREEL